MPRPRVYKTQAIVLRQRKLGEADKIVTLYCSQWAASTPPQEYGAPRAGRRTSGRSPRLYSSPRVATSISSRRPKVEGYPTQAAT